MPSVSTEALRLLRNTLDYLEEIKGSSLFASPQDCDYFRKRYAPTRVYRNNLKNRDFGKEAPQNFDPERATLAGRQGASEDQNSEVKLTRPKTDSSSCFGIEIAKTLPPLVVESLPKEAPPPPSAPVLPKEEKPPPAPPEKREPRPKPELAPQPVSPAQQFEELRALWPRIAAGAPLLEEIPSDTIAKRIASRWKTKNQTAPISILAFHEPPAQRALLEQIAKAIDVSFGPARLVPAEPIEKEKQWEAFLSVPHFKLVVACDYTLWQLSGLMQHYREVPSLGTRHLGTVPLLLLPDLSLYLKDPILKRSLWKALCQKLTTA